MYWTARARRDYICDKCGEVIRKGEERVVEGQKALCYTMIDRNFHKQCAPEGAKDDKNVEGGK